MGQSDVSRRFVSIIIMSLITALACASSELLLDGLNLPIWIYIGTAIATMIWLSLFFLNDLPFQLKKCPQCGKRVTKTAIGKEPSPLRRGEPGSFPRYLVHYRCSSCDADLGTRRQMTAPKIQE